MSGIPKEEIVLIKEKLSKKKKNRVRKRKPRIAKNNVVVREINKIDKSEGARAMNELKDLRRRQKMFEDTVTKGIDPKYAKYMLTVMDPSNHQSKMPDSYNTPVALYKSVRVLPININFSTNTEGKFAILVRPIIGNITPTKANSQIMVSKPGTTDLLDDANYDYYSDPQVEAFSSGLGGEWATIGYTNGNLRTMNASEYIGYILFDTLVVNLDTIRNGLAITLTEINAPSVLTSFLTYDGKQCAIRAGGLTYGVGGLSGWHSVSTYGNYPGSSLETATKAYFLFGEISDEGVVTPLVVTGASTASYIADHSKYRAYGFDTFVANTYSTSQGLCWRENFYYNFDSTKKYIISGVAISGTTDYLQQSITFSKVNPPSGAEGSSSLLIPTYRPIAQSAILTNVTPKLYEGGTLACMSVIKGETQYFLEPNATYNFRTLDGISTSNADDNNRLSLAMKAEKGAYTFWLPYQNVNAPNFADLSTSNSTDFGGIIFCGNVPAQSGVSTVFYLKVTTIFEYTTPNRLIETKSYVGDQTKLTAAMNNIISQKSIVFENPTHLKKIQDAILSCLSPIYGVSMLTGTDPVKNLEKYGKIASKVLSSVSNGETAMDLIPMVLGAF